MYVCMHVLECTCIFAAETGIHLIHIYIHMHVYMHVCSEKRCSTHSYICTSYILAYIMRCPMMIAANNFTHLTHTHKHKHTYFIHSRIYNAVSNDDCSKQLHTSYTQTQTHILHTMPRIFLTHTIRYQVWYLQRKSRLGVSPQEQQLLPGF